MRKSFSAGPLWICVMALWILALLQFAAHSVMTPAKITIDRYKVTDLTVSNGRLGVRLVRISDGANAEAVGVSPEWAVAAYQEGWEVWGSRSKTEPVHIDAEGPDGK